MRRRTLLQGLLLLVGLDPAGLAGRVRQLASRVVQRVVEPSAATGTLSGPERDDLVAFAEVLVEGRTLVPAERRDLVLHIEDRTQRDPGYLSLYRTAVSTLERLAGRRFASLELRERVELIARHRLAAAQVWPREDLGPFPTQMRSLRTRVVPDLIAGYYSSAAGWAAVGYQTFPGRCGDLTRYTRPET